jgi:transposase
MKILRAIVAGERDVAVLAEFRDVRCKSSVETIRQALTGNFRPEHVFALRQALELYDTYQEKMRDCDVHIEAALQALHREPSPVGPDPTPGHSKPRKLRKQKNDPAFDVRQVLKALLGVDLTGIHGIGPHAALQIIAECGTDMRRWPTAKHFTSWLTLAPGCKISGGKVLSAKTRRSANRAAHLFRMAAVAVGKTSTALGAFYRRLGLRVGKGKAVIATARKLAILVYNTLRHGVIYEDTGATAYEEKYRKRSVETLRRRAKSLGFELTEIPSAGGVS